MKRTSGTFAAIFFNKSGRAQSIFGSYELYPAGTIGIPPKIYDSGKATFSIKDIERQEITESKMQVSLKIEDDNWSIGVEPAYNKWNSYHGEPYDTLLTSIKEDYFTATAE